MSDSWYYVHKGNRQGPVAVEVITSMLSKQELRPDDYVWKKGFENWKKIKDVPDFENQGAPASSSDFPPSPEISEAPKSPVMEKEFSLKDVNPDERILFIRIGTDRGAAATDYGPFSLKQMKQLFKENRISGKTCLFSKGMKEWKLLADLPEYQEIFEELPPVIKEAERRTTTRKPFVARLFVQNNKNIFEGICRDISIGGMQILMDNFQGTAGDKITINVHPENTDHHFVAAGVVVRVLEGNSGFSFRFQGLSDEAKKSIDKYLQNN